MVLAKELNCNSMLYGSKGFGTCGIAGAAAVVLFLVALVLPRAALPAPVLETTLPLVLPEVAAAGCLTAAGLSVWLVLPFAPVILPATAPSVGRS